MFQTADLLTYIKPSKPNALACYLAARQGRLVSRTALLGLFWDESPEREARRALTTTLGRIHQTWPDLRIHTDGDAVGCELISGLELDLDLFNRWQRGENPPSDGPTVTPWLNAEATQAVPATGHGLSAAAALYRAEFMAEFQVPGCPGFDAWLIEQRRFWEDRCVETLARLTKLEEDAGAWAALSGHARQGLAILPQDERFRRGLMQALAMQGDRAGALAHYEHLQRELELDLGIQPEMETRDLRDAIAAGTLAERHRTGPQVTRTESVRAITRTEPELVPMVGRAHQAAILRGILSADHQQPQMALVLGELGIGKSRLVAEVVASVPGGVTVLTGRCYEDHSKLPYAPIIQVLREALPAFDGGRPPLDEVWLKEISRLLPELSIAVTASVQDEPDNSSDPLRLCEAVTRFLAAIQGRLILVFEDLHWADEASLLVLAYLLRSSAVNQTKVTATIRMAEAPQALERLLAQLEREGRLQRIHVSDLTLPQVEELTAAMAGREAKGLAARVFAETNGHPFFTVALIRTLLDRQDTSAPQAPALPMPESVEALIYARMARFPAAARELAVTLAIFPQGATLRDLSLMTGLSTDEVAELVEPALLEGILHDSIDTRGADGMLGPAVRYSHELVRRTVLGSVTKLRQRLLHSRAFEVIRDQIPQRDDHSLPLGVADQLSYHATAAHRWEESARWIQAAADSAEIVFAYPIATLNLDQALADRSSLVTAESDTDTARLAKQDLPDSPRGNEDE